MKRTVLGAVFVIGLLVGLVMARWLPERVVEAQTNWQCKSWGNLAPAADVTAAGTWLASAKSVQITAAGLSAATYTLVACKQ